MKASPIRRTADVHFKPTRKPSREARALLATWTSRRRGAVLPRLREFTLVDLQPWLAGMTLTTRLDATPQVDFYGGSLAASVGQFFAGAWRPEWPSWFEVIGWRTRARLHSSPEPFIEQVWLKDGECLRVYDRLVIPVGDGGSKADGWISFIDNRRHLRSSARAGLIIDR